MLTSLTLKNFRGFNNLEIPRLARVNLIGGVNNAGKTAILEAIFLLLERDSEAIIKLPGLFRARTEVNDDRYFWRWLGPTSITGETSITADLSEEDSITTLWTRRMDKGGGIFHSGGFSLIPQSLTETRLMFWPSLQAFSPGPTAPVEDAQVYIRAAKKSGNEERIEELLREVDPRLKRVRAYPDEENNLPLLHVDLGGSKSLPATQLGQGFNRLLRIYSSLLGAGAEVTLIDEVETGLHHSVLPTIWKGLAVLARRENVQIFATTHSREAILAAHRVFSEEPDYDFAYHRLERDIDGQVRVVTYDQSRLEGADERNFEVR